VSLFPYQQHGAEYMAERKGNTYLADPPGLGKSRTAIRACQIRKAQSIGIICPAIVRTHWKRELAVMGFPYGAADIVSYEGAHKLGTYHDALIIDEAHYLKNSTAKRTKNILGTHGLARTAGLVLPLSGTPIVKHADDLWPVLSSLFPEVLTSFGISKRAQWQEKFCYMEYNPWSRGQAAKGGAVKNREHLRHILDLVWLRRSYAEVSIDMPELFWSVETLDADGANIEVPPELAHALELGLPLPKLLEDHAIAKYRRLVGEAKAMAVATLIADEVNGGRSEVVFAHHRGVLETLRLALRSLGVSYVDGSTSPADRERAIDDFQSGKNKVFLGQQKACETGITLTASQRVTLVEPSWTSVNNVQAGRRVARIGQQAGSCFARMIALGDTIDEAVVGRHYKEASMLASIDRQFSEAIA
jgi:SWI/SNF-related matrix-associated actin-dependent regulator 1 of chromatin subfamily A